MPNLFQGLRMRTNSLSWHLWPGAQRTSVEGVRVMYSPLLQELLQSDHVDEHCVRILDGSTSTTVIRYLQCLLQVIQLAWSMRLDLRRISEVHLADLIAAGRESKIGFHMSIKAMRWAVKTLQVQCFIHSSGPLASSFLKLKVPHDRKETLPYPLIALVQWERRILQSSTASPEILLLGAFLLMAWCSLRFSDLRRSSPLSWRTKTGVNGAPFGALASGFLSIDSWNWVEKWLRTLDQLLFAHNAMDVDFLLPGLTRNGLAIDVPLRPMTYSEALYWVRRYLPWKNSSPIVANGFLSYTIHGLKSTFLSWASQLQLDKDLRRLQGHRRADSAQLYSRDDINGAISLQTQIVASVKKHWRPRTPLARRGQVPVAEPESESSSSSDDSSSSSSSDSSIRSQSE